MPKLLTVTAYAKHRGVSQPRISYLIREGRIKKGIAKRKGRRLWIDPAIADQEIEAGRDPRWESKQKGIDTTPEKKQAQPAGQAGTGGMMDAHTLKTAMLQYKLANEKLEYEIKSGKWIPSDIVKKAFFEAGRQTRDQIHSLPDRVAALVAAENDTFECKKILQTEIDYILEGLSSALQMPE